MQGACEEGNRKTAIEAAVLRVGAAEEAGGVLANSDDELLADRFDAQPRQAVANSKIRTSPRLHRAA